MERDDEAFEEVLDAVAEEIEVVSADGAYDKRKCYEAIESRGAKANIPPRVDAQYWEQEGETHARNQVARIFLADQSVRLLSRTA
ncbi:MAG: transposase [Xenococcaceae cyanobacterium MO_188.B32]|nr:transposase [Xenococcaceae cyanobacterium MO_188.B32]